MYLKEGYWLRMGASLNSEGVRVNREEQKVTVLDRGNGWSLVRLQSGRRYWVSADGLNEQNDAVVDTNRAKVFRADHNNWAIRNKPGTRTLGSRVIDHVSNQTNLQYLGPEQDGDGDTWYRVKYKQNGQTRTGYIFEGHTQATNTSTEACDTCEIPNSPDGPVQSQTKTIAKIAAQNGQGFKLPKSYDPRCSKFINADGLGEYGRYMVAAAKKIAPTCFYDRNVFNSVCPNYRSLEPPQQNAFIALLFATIGHFESNCKISAQAPGENDLADGLFQLEYSARVRHKSGRNRQYCSTNQPVDTQSLSFQSECAVSTVKDTVCSWGSFINSPDGYWKKLRNDRAITELVKKTAKQWGLCKWPLNI